MTSSAANKGERGTNPPGVCQTTILPNFRKKLHEIEKILGHGRGTCAGAAPPLDPPLITQISFINFLRYGIFRNKLS